MSSSVWVELSTLFQLQTKVFILAALSKMMGPLLSSPREQGTHIMHVCVLETHMPVKLY